MSLNIQRTSFGTLYPTRKERPVDSKLSRTERTGVAAASMLGVAGALAILAKTAKWKKFSLNPKVIMNSKIKDTYLYQVKYEEPEILAMGAGSILGGLVRAIPLLHGLERRSGCFDHQIRGSKRWIHLQSCHCLKEGQGCR